MKFSPAILLPFLMYCSQFAHAEYFAAPYFREAAVNVGHLLLQLAANKGVKIKYENEGAQGVCFQAVCDSTA